MIRATVLLATILFVVLIEVRASNTHVVITTDAQGVGGILLVDGTPAEMKILVGGELQPVTVIPSEEGVSIDLKDSEWHRVSIRRVSSGTGPSQFVKADERAEKTIYIRSLPPALEVPKREASRLSRLTGLQLAVTVAAAAMGTLALSLFLYMWIGPRPHNVLEWPKYMDQEHPHLRPVRKLGRGGFGKVFEIENRKRKKRFGKAQARTVVKILHEENNQGEGAHRFHVEPQALAYIEHNSKSKNMEKLCPTPYDIGLEHPGMNVCLWYEMEYFSDCDSLRTVMRDNKGAFQWEQAFRYLSPLYKKLNLLHHLEVIHRDLSPENVMVSRDICPTVYFIDFGSANWPSRAEAAYENWDQFTVAGSALGKDPYTAPEQLIDMKTATRYSDWFGFGCIAWELITGHKPYAKSLSSQHNPLAIAPLISRKVPKDYAAFFIGLLDYHPEVRRKVLESSGSLWPP